MDFVSLSKYVPAMITVFSLMIVLALLFKKFGGIKVTPGNDLAVLKTIHLGGKEKLVLVEIDTIRVLLGVTSSSINSVLELRDNTENANANVANIQKFSAVSDKVN